MSLAIQQYAVGGFDENFSYLIYDTKSAEAVVIDPTGDLAALHATVTEKQLTVTGMYLTHTHHDHFDKLDEIIAAYGTLPIYVYQTGAEVVGTYDTIITLEDHQTLTLGSGRIQVLYTPGHTDDGVCYFIAAEHSADGTPQVITGDTLFVGGCGRTTPHRVKDLYESLAELRLLPDNTLVYPGHDYGETATSTMEHERKHNKYYLAENFNAFRDLRLG